MLNLPVQNLTFIDGQNLHFGTKLDGWYVNHQKFRIYLRDKYQITDAYYFLGFKTEKEQKLYENLRKAGFQLLFRDHEHTMKALKKGNVDSEIIFDVMKKIADNEQFEKIFIVSGDGDYKKLVNYLIVKNKFGKMLFPNKNFASSLYDNLGREFFDYLNEKDVRLKIEYAP